MSYRVILNPFTGNLQLVQGSGLITFKPAVATVGSLPSSGNNENDGRIVNDTHHLYIWDGSSWIDQGDILDITWAAISGKPSSSVENIDDAVSKRHTQDTDTALRTDKLTVDVDGNTEIQGSFDLPNDQIIKFGGDAFIKNWETKYSIAIGKYAGTNTQYSVYMGFQAGLDNQGNDNVSIGYNSGANNTGISSSFLGHSAGYNNTGHYITSIGRRAGIYNIGDNCIFLGYEAGKDNSLDNQFIVKQNNINTTPLIQGDFSTGNIALAGELKIKVYSQASEPTLNADSYMAIWIDTDDSNKVYLVFRRGTGDQVKIELT